MSAQDLISADLMGTPMTTPVLEQQPDLLQEAINVVKLQGFHMKKCIVV
jgi:hypothetical protein